LVQYGLKPREKVNMSFAEEEKEIRGIADSLKSIKP
jgi:hypothetical protein